MFCIQLNGDDFSNTLRREENGAIIQTKVSLFF